MKKRIFAILLALVMLAAFIPASVSASVTATPSSHTVFVNGNAVALRAFNIEGRNFFMLRDVAYVLMDTTARFDVFWDSTRSAISLTRGVTYNPVGGGLSAGGTTAVNATASTAVVYVNDSRVNLRAYNINGHNYFMLVDLGASLGFNVDWDANAAAILITTPAGTTPQPPTQPPTQAPTPTPTPSATPRPSSPGTFNSITATEWVAGVRMGWNLGNQFDARGQRNSGASVSSMESLWTGGVTVSRQLIDGVSNAGFNAIRIPVSWHKALDADYNIREDWLRRVRHVVDYAVANDMYILLNTHHDDELFRLDDANMAESRRAVETIWRQIATEFRDYNERLAFQGFNEPRTRGSAREWNGGTRAERDNLNILHQVFVDTVRATGGNNAQRVLFVQTYGAHPGQEAVGGLVLPNDSAQNRIGVSIHFYTPYNFALTTGSNAVSTWSRSNSSDTGPITDNIDRIHNTFVRNGIPVVISEMGAMNRNNVEARSAWTEFYFASAAARGIPCFWWDNGSDGVSRQGHEATAIFNRRNGQISQPEIIDAMIRATQ
jgi:endoglucanase